MTLHLTLKMTTTLVVETSVTNNSLSKDYPHLDDHAKQIKTLSQYYALCTCVYIYIRQLSSFRAPVLIDLTVATILKALTVREVKVIDLATVD